MALNGTEWLNNPWIETFSPYTDLFERLMGVGGAFWLIPVIVLTFGIYVKTENPVMATMFMIGSGALLGAGNIFTGNTEMSILFTVFTALGITGLVASLLYGER